MFDDINSPELFVAVVIGGFCGSLLSIVIKNYYQSDRLETSNNRVKKTVKAILWSTATVLTAWFPILLSLKNDSFASAFIWTFFAGVSIGHFFWYES